MSYIARLYASRQSVDAVLGDLKRQGLDGYAHVVAPPAGDAAHEPELVHDPDSFGSDAVPAGQPPGAHPENRTAAELKRAGVDRSHARILAERIAQGETLVVVHPPFLMGEPATHIMDRHNPSPVDLPELAWNPNMVHGHGHGHGFAPGEFGAYGDDAAPLSRAFGWRVLLADPQPLSRYLGWATLKAEARTSATLASIRSQSAAAAPLSRITGAPTLSGNPAPLSSAAKLAVLQDDPAPLSKKAKWRVLLDDAAPLSGRLGWKTISRSASPLSSALGLTVLTRKQ